MAVIMAGGSGERFWPLSRRNHPKQLLRLTHPTETMLAEAVKRIGPVVPRDQVYVQTSPHLLEPIRQGQIGVADDHIIAEPYRRNTAGCLAYAAAYLLSTHGGDGSNITMAILTADHIIRDEEQFCRTVSKALEVAESEESLVTIGIVPDRPATGYGYVHGDRKFSEAKIEEPEAYSVLGFREKPDAATAQTYVDSREYFWNSGMFFWRISTFLSELEASRPEFAHAVHSMAASMKAGNVAEAEATFEALESISIDYALMEHAQHVSVVQATFGWDDVGTWASLDRVRKRDVQGNVCHGDPVLVDCNDSIVYQSEDAKDMAVAVVGAKDMVVVVTHDAVLVMPKEQSESVKAAVQELTARKARQL
jgi:mannose-1-phosphate guanylyltransferase